MDNINSIESILPATPHPVPAKLCYAASLLLALPAGLMAFPLAGELDGLRWPYLWAAMMPLSAYTMLWLSPRVRFWDRERRKAYLNALIGIAAFGIFAHLRSLGGDMFGMLVTVFCFVPFYASLFFTLASAFLPQGRSHD